MMDYVSIRVLDFLYNEVLDITSFFHIRADFLEKE